MLAGEQEALTEVTVGDVVVLTTVPPQLMRPNKPAKEKADKVLCAICASFNSGCPAGAPPKQVYLAINPIFLRKADSLRILPDLDHCEQRQVRFG
jgi:hypothetical protein